MGRIAVIGTATRAKRGTGPYVEPETEPENIPPVAGDSSLTMTLGTSRTIDLLALASDADGTVTLTSVSPLSGGGTYTPNLGAGTVQVVANNGAQAGTPIIFSYLVTDNDGATDGGNVTISVASTTGAGSFSIKINRTTSHAPFVPFFEAHNISGFSVDHPTQQLFFLWDFGDVGSKFKNLSGRLDMLNEMDSTQLKWTDANKAWGFLASHCYRAPGTYTVRCYCYRPGSTTPTEASNTLTVTVTNPDNVYSSARTLYVANTSGGLSYAPAGANTLVTDDLNTAIAGMSAPRRILFRRGDTFKATTGGKGGESYYGAFGPGTERWKIDGTGRVKDDGDAFNLVNNCNEVRIVDCELFGEYNAVTNSAVGTRQGVGNFGIGLNFRGNVVYDNCLSRNSETKCYGGYGGSIAVTDPDVATNTTMSYVDCEAKDYLDYGFYGKYPFVSFLGTWVHRDPAAGKYTPNVDAGVPEPGYNTYDSGGGAAMRVEKFGSPTKGGAVFGGVDARCWFMGHFDDDQPPIKVQGDAQANARWCADRVITDGATSTCHGVGTTPADIQNAFVMNWIHIASANNGLPLSFQNAGTGFYNFYYIQPYIGDMEKLPGRLDNHYAIKLRSTGSVANENGPFYLGGWTICYLVDAEAHTTWDFPFVISSAESDSPDTTVSTPMPGVYESANHVIHVPWDWGQTRVGPVSIGSPGRNFSGYPGRRHINENGDAMQTQFAINATFTYSRDGVTYTNRANFGILKPTGSALTAEAGPLPPCYIDGTMRGIAPAKGAFKP